MTKVAEGRTTAQHNMTDEEPGGFIPAFLSPPPSTVASSTTAARPLPTPRSQPLRSGSAKESAFINAVDQRITQITRRFAKKQGGIDQYAQDETTGTRGYHSFKEAGKDIERVADIVWVSGTPTLQVPYLISLALLVLTCIPAFPSSPKAMFRVLNKLDYAFASLVQKQDLDSGKALPGFLGSSGLTPTEKVRIKSLVERTRVAVVEAMNAKDFEVEDEEDDEDEYDETDAQDVGVDYDADDMGNDYGMDIARVYDRTLVELGDTLGGPVIGIDVE